MTLDAVENLSDDDATTLALSPNVGRGAANTNPTAKPKPKSASKSTATPKPKKESKKKVRESDVPFGDHMI